MEAEAEDIVQAAYLSAYAHCTQFAERAEVATWLTRITINESLARQRQHKRREGLAQLGDGAGWRSGGQPPDSPGEHLAGKQLATELESAIDALPESCRLAFMMLQVEELSISEVATALQTTENNIRTQRHRARASLKRHLLARFEPGMAKDVFSFAGERCARIARHVLDALELSQV